MNKTFDFEKKMKELELIVSKLENGDPQLDKALKSFEKGVKISAELKKYLSNAQKEIDQNLGKLNLNDQKNINKNHSEEK